MYLFSNFDIYYLNKFIKIKKFARMMKKKLWKRTSLERIFLLTLKLTILQYF